MLTSPTNIKLSTTTIIVDANTLSSAYALFALTIYTPSPLVPPNHSATVAATTIYVTDILIPENSLSIDIGNFKCIKVCSLLLFIVLNKFK